MKLRYLAIPVVVAGIVMMPFCTTVVPAGHVGAVYDKMQKGVQNYTLSEGFHFKAPWQKVNDFPTSIETIYMSADKREGSEENEEINVGCADGSLYQGGLQPPLDTFRPTILWQAVSRFRVPFSGRLLRGQRIDTRGML